MAHVTSWLLVGFALTVILAAAFMAHPRSRAAIRTGGRAVARLARDERIPRPLRWLLLLALLPIPGPVEEIAGGLALAVIGWRYRDALKDALK